VTAAGYGGTVMWRKIAVLLAMWCVLVVVPAWIAGDLLHRGGGDSHMGWVAGIWIGGYLAQFVLFIVIGRKSPCGTGPGKMVAALVPWLAYWTTPLSLWALLPVAGIVIGYSMFLAHSVFRLDVLRRDGVEARAVVLEVIRPSLNVVVDRDHARRVMRLRIDQTDEATSYEARVTGAFTLGEIPEPGDSVVIRVDPKRPRHIELVEGAPVARAAANIVDIAPRAAEQLRILKTMRDRGDLTDAEFATAKARLVD